MILFWIKMISLDIFNDSKRVKHTVRLQRTRFESIPSNKSGQYYSNFYEIYSFEFHVINYASYFTYWQSNNWASLLFAETSFSILYSKAWTVHWFKFNLFLILNSARDLGLDFAWRIRKRDIFTFWQIFIYTQINVSQATFYSMHLLIMNVLCLT